MQLPEGDEVLDIGNAECDVSSASSSSAPTLKR
jgi:hypothetical protein